MSVTAGFGAGLFVAGAMTAQRARTWPTERKGWFLMFAALALSVAAMM